MILARASPFKTDMTRGSYRCSDNIISTRGSLFIYINSRQSVAAQIIEDDHYPIADIIVNNV